MTTRSTTPLMDRINRARGETPHASHTSQATEVLSVFQRWAEYGSGMTCNYDALRATLKSVRGRQDFTLDELKADYISRL